MSLSCKLHIFFHIIISIYIMKALRRKNTVTFRSSSDEKTVLFFFNLFYIYIKIKINIHQVIDNTGNVYNS